MDVGFAFEDVGTTIYNKALQPVYKQVIEPTYEEALKPTYQTVLKPVGEKAQEIGVGAAGLLSATLAK